MDWQIEQYNRTKSTELDPHFYGQFFFDQSHKEYQWRKESLVSQNNAGTIGYVFKEGNLTQTSYHLQKWILKKYRCKQKIKYSASRRNHEKIIVTLGISKYFINRT